MKVEVSFLNEACSVFMAMIPSRIERRRTPRLTHDADVADLADGDLGVDLTHVRPGVALPHVLDGEVPRAVAVVRHADAVVARDHVVAHRQDGRAVALDPGELRDQRGSEQDCISIYRP